MNAILKDKVTSKKLSIALMQPYFFPYIGYFQLLNKVDKFIIYDDVNFIKSGWVNRNNILLNGKKNMISLPVEKISSYRLICDTKIQVNDNWIKKFLKSIEYGYKKSNYYDDVIQIIEKVIASNIEYINELNLLSIKLIVNYLDIKTEIISSSSIYNNLELSGQERVLDICKKENATHYINPIGGLELYNRKDFNNQGINISFLETNQFKYNQLKNDFIPNLSILDVMMFNSPKEIKKMLNDYRLI